MYTPMACMLTHSLPLATVCGGIGAITPMAGVAILTLAGAGTIGMAQIGDTTGAGEAGTAVVGTAAAGGDTIITIIPDIILVEVTGVADIGIEALLIPIVVLPVRPILTGIVAVLLVALQVL